MCLDQLMCTSNFYWNVDHPMYEYFFDNTKDLNFCSQFSILSNWTLNLSINLPQWFSNNLKEKVLASLKRTFKNNIFLNKDTLDRGAPETLSLENSYIVTQELVNIYISQMWYMAKHSKSNSITIFSLKWNPKSCNWWASWTHME